eukprot:TRINITY_DN2621_c1_g2_i1.p1 TRINITY_DN2621_c1_g2~~TRINITY_DN2621_c1_g2_i1.p1  ORF type:complete len:422 (+),score=47.40 TRINITY_DN2621_c1_g2_i1:83-1267(+)
MPVSAEERRARMKLELQKEVRCERHRVRVGRKNVKHQFEQRPSSPSRRKIDDGAHLRSKLANTGTGLTLSPNAPKGSVRRESVKAGSGSCINKQCSETTDDNFRFTRRPLQEPRKDSVQRRIRAYAPEPSNTKNPVPRSMSLGSSPRRHKTSTEINEGRTGKRRSNSITSQSSGNIIGHSNKPQFGKIYNSPGKGGDTLGCISSEAGQLRGRRWASTPRRVNNANIVEHRSPSGAWGARDREYHSSIRPSSRIRCNTPGEDNRDRVEKIRGKRCDSPLSSIRRNHGNVIAHDNCDGSNPPPHARNLKGCLAAPPVFVPETINFNPAIHRKQSPCSFKPSDVLNTNNNGGSSDPFLGITGKPSSTPNGSPRMSRGRGCFSPVLTTDPITHRLLEC